MQVIARGNARRELNEVMIQQWYASLDGMGHAHPIDLGQDVARQICLHVQILELRHEWQAVRWPKVLGDSIRRAAAAPSRPIGGNEREPL